jgi:DNA invertase Pin-like site-specific DNA recombinase
MPQPIRVAIYARVSTADQHTDNQLFELRRYCEARGWQATEYVDEGVSGAKESRPALDAMLKAARRRRFNMLIVLRLDRLGRSLRHLILLLDELAALGVAFVSLAEGIDCTTPAGRLQLHILGAIAEFERRRLRERVVAGLDRARRDGKRLGRPPCRVTGHDLDRTRHLPLRQAADILGVSHATVARARLSQKPAQQNAPIAAIGAGSESVVSL